MSTEAQEPLHHRHLGERHRAGAHIRRITPRTWLILAAAALLILVLAAWIRVADLASSIETDLKAVARLMPEMRQQVAETDIAGARGTAESIRLHTAAASRAAHDPLWEAASGLPWAGPNFSTVTEVARSADEITRLGLLPLINVLASLDWDTLVPRESGTDLEPMKAAAPSVAAAADAVRASSDRLAAIDDRRVWPQVADQLNLARGQLREVTGALSAAADAARVAPAMLGADAPRNYLLMIQNNAESRASGGIPGALAVITLDRGKLTLSAQRSAADLGTMTPALGSDPEQLALYTARLGTAMQDVNLTPDFPSAAATARAMWERKTGQGVDGVISIDPVALSYILAATGPVKFTGLELVAAAAVGLPTELTEQNVVPTLLSDVYAKIAQPKSQDEYFAGAARQIFGALSSGKPEAAGLMTALTQGTAEGRVRVWSAATGEQDVLGKYDLGGSISGPSLAPAQFGIYLNDDTGAKMDYYVRRTVQLVKACPRGGFEQTTVRVKSTNTAPVDAATSLPAYVTGGGRTVEPGSVRTNVVAYGPLQANVEAVTEDGRAVDLSPHLHQGRPVAVHTIVLKPGESKTIDFSFGKISQDTEPELAVTPTIQRADDVLLPPLDSPCG